jgi:hypothetical protein
MSVIHPRAVRADKDLFNLLQALTNRVFNNPGLAAGTTNTRVKTANAVTYAIGGRLYSKAATDPVDDFDGAFTNTAAGQFCKVRLEIDASGVVSGSQGVIASAQALAPMPRRSANKATLGWIEIPASFTFGTTSYGTATFFNGDPDLHDGSIPPHDRGLSQDVLTGP